MKYIILTTILFTIYNIGCSDKLSDKPRDKLIGCINFSSLIKVKIDNISEHRAKFRHEAIRKLQDTFCKFRLIQKIDEVKHQETIYVASEDLKNYLEYIIESMIPLRYRDTEMYIYLCKSIEEKDYRDKSHIKDSFKRYISKIQSGCSFSSEFIEVKASKVDFAVKEFEKLSNNTHRFSKYKDRYLFFFTDPDTIKPKEDEEIEDHLLMVIEEFIDPKVIKRDITLENEERLKFAMSKFKELSDKIYLSRNYMAKYVNNEININIFIDPEEKLLPNDDLERMSIEKLIELHLANNNIRRNITLKNEAQADLFINKFEELYSTVYNTLKCEDNYIHIIIDPTTDNKDDDKMKAELRKIEDEFKSNKDRNKIITIKVKDQNTAYGLSFIFGSYDYSIYKKRG